MTLPCVKFEHSQSLATLVICDATPAFTTFVSAACPATLPAAISAGSVSLGQSP
jgi:hypothetical protein